MRKLGWMPDLPDIRDFSYTIVPASKTPPQGFPSYIDNRKFCSPIEDQGDLGSCTAHAGAGMYEYFQNRAYGKYINLSRLFLYKTTRNYMQLHGDTGAWLRSTMGAMLLFGVPPEKYYPYDISKFDVEPSAFLYSFAQSFQAIKYFRLDTVGTSPADLLIRLKSYTFRGFSTMFGFSVYSSIWDMQYGTIPMPARGESLDGGHAIMIVGYDDDKIIKGPYTNSPQTQGAFLIRNSWGIGWGESGYGWLPYDYVLYGLADDFWSMTKGEWIETGQFDE